MIAAVFGFAAVLWSERGWLWNTATTGMLMESATPENPDAVVVFTEVTAEWYLDDDPTLGPSIVADVAVPERRQMMRVSIRKNLDPEFPASHVVELSVEPTVYPGKDIESVPLLSLKQRPEDRGRPIVGAPVKVADNRFWIALSNDPADVQSNVTLLENAKILYFNITYANGRQAALGIEKGGSGEAVFRQAFAAWAR